MSSPNLAPQVDTEGGVELGVGWDYAPLPIGLIQGTAPLGLQNSQPLPTESPQNALTSLFTLWSSYIRLAFQNSEGSSLAPLCST